MQSLRIIAAACIASVAFQATLCDARALRSSSQEVVATIADPPSSKAIKEKWDKMDEFLKVMFSMACKWKHGKDIDGLTAEKLKKGDLDGAAEVKAYKSGLQKANVQHMVQSCGKLTGSGKHRCRQSCSDRWGTATVKRQDCDAKCVKVYDRFEGSCESKADDLVKVYELKQSKSEGMKTCYEGFCKKFPTVWLKEKNSDMKSERDKICKENICTEKGIKAQCQKKWGLEADGATAKAKQECFDASKMKECFGKKSKKAGDDEKKCASDGKKDCGKAFDDCKKKGNTDKTFKDAEAFCVDRKKMCLEQSSDKCLAAHKSDLNDAQKTCEKEQGEAAKECMGKKMKAAQKEAEGKCTAAKKESCPKDCKASCQVDKLESCIGDLKTEDPAKMFCLDFWTLLHDSSEVDPVTGNPIVLMAAQSVVHK